jgi:undecaprenyl diphosphate synthase
MTFSNLMPQHIAIVMDGNGRWASKRFLPRVAGHKQGVDALRHCVSTCVQRGVQVLTVFAFSSENWNRPTEEVSGLMSLFALALSREVPKLKAQGVRLHFIGDRANLSQSVINGMSKSELDTCTNETLVLNVCFNYGGRWDIVQAAAKLMDQGTPVTEQSLSSAMALSHVGDPDLVIRTGGEQRISNFLLWQSAYSEFYFSEKLWPDFDEAALDQAIASYLQRERRFGKTTAQLAGPNDSKASTA